MSKIGNTKQNFILNKINEIKLESFKITQNIIPSYSIVLNENSFATVFYHYKVEFTETKIDFIKFFSYINNNFILVGQYDFNDKIIEDPSDFIQMKVENGNLIILTKNYLIVEKIIIKNNEYTFKNIISKNLNENLYKILENNKFVSYDKNIFKIYQFSIEEDAIKCLFEISYDIFESNHIFKNEYKKENNENKNNNYFEEESYNQTDKEEDEDYIFQNAEISNKLCDIIEIKEKKLIIISFSKSKHAYHDNDIDYTLSKYIISIIDTNNYQIIANLFNLIEAENLFYFGNNELFSFGFRHFFKLNLKTLKKELILSENHIDSGSHYYHYNIIPFLNKNKLLSFGYYRCGYYHNRDEYKHCCLFDIKKNYLKEIDITNIYFNKYDVQYFPLKLNDDKILFVFEDDDMGLFELKIKENKPMKKKEKFKYKTSKRNYNEVIKDKTEPKPKFNPQLKKK